MEYYNVMPEIITESITDKCAHRSCSCPARADTGYCGSYCMTASKNPDPSGVCGCGHPECKPGDIPMPTQASK
jgi:hypothetical protein